MGHHFWKARGRADLAGVAAREARREAKRAGISLKLLDRVLSQPSRYQIDNGIYVPVAESSVAEIKKKKLEEVETWAGVMYKWNEYSSGDKNPHSLPERASRRVNGSFRWWTGNQTAYLDLMYRKLPEMIEARFKRDPADTTFRIWHAGYENGSQSLFLAAAVDAAVAGLKLRARGDLRRYLDKLKVEIVATDLMYRLQHTGRRELRFDPPGYAFASIEMYTLLTEELGPTQHRMARREVTQLERALGRARSEPARQKILDKLADAGGVGVAMERMMKVSPRVDHFSYHPRMIYQLHAKHWRIDDGPNKRVLNRAAKNRTLRFRLGDLTEGAPRGKWDLVVCSNVLPYLADYQRIVGRENGSQRIDRAAAEAAAARDARKATRHLTRNLKPGGKLLVDIYSEQTLQGIFPKKSRLQDQTWVTRARSIEALDPAPSTETL
jgi:SAM-dependent methyltransferase